MGFFRTFIEAYKFRRQSIKIIGPIYYMGRMREVISQDSKQVTLKGIRNPISREYLLNLIYQANAKH